MRFGAFPILKYEWRTSLSPEELARKLETLIREERQIVGNGSAEGFRLKLGRTGGFSHVVYVGTIEAIDSGSRVRATAQPTFGSEVPRGLLWTGIAIGIICLLGALTQSRPLLIAGMGAGWIVGSIVLFYLQRARYWLGAEEIQAYLLDRFREPVVVKTFSKLP